MTVCVHESPLHQRLGNHPFHLKSWLWKHYALLQKTENDSVHKSFCYWFRKNIHPTQAFSNSGHKQVHREKQEGGKQK